MAKRGTSPGPIAESPTPSSEMSAGVPENSPEQDALVADLQRLEQNLEQMAKEREGLHEQLLRTMADMQNYKRRVEQERVALQTRATEALLKDLLPVLDSFDRTLAAASNGASPESMAEGVRGVDRQLRTVLESRKLTRIPSVGLHFDPELHDAILIDPSSDQPEGTIVEELEAGYRLGDSVLRPARVRVAKGLA